MNPVILSRYKTFANIYLHKTCNKLFKNSFTKSCLSFTTSASNENQANEHSALYNRIQDEIAQLNSEERRALILELQIHESVDIKQKAEEKLASWRWRTRFGRLSSVQKLGVDPTGTYCEIPHDWLQKKIAEQAKVTPPSTAQLRQLAIFNSLPFIGFGFLDNLVMILAGDYIDVTIGGALGISTMAAAALGNTISDLAGIGSGCYVEILAEKSGVKAPEMTQEQLDHGSARTCANLGRAIGVVVGCLLGMFPLLFKSSNKSDSAEKDDAGVTVSTTTPDESRPDSPLSQNNTNDKTNDSTS